MITKETATYLGEALNVIARNTTAYPESETVLMPLSVNIVDVIRQYNDLPEHPEEQRDLAIRYDHLFSENIKLSSEVDYLHKKYKLYFSLVLVLILILFLFLTL